MLKQSIFVIIHGLGFILLTSLPRIIMNWREVNINNIGLVMSGFSIGEYVNVILLGFATAVVPKIQKYYREKNFIGLKNVFIFIQVSGVLVVALYATWLHDVFIFLVRNRDLYSAKYFAQFSLFNNTFLPFYVLLSSIVFIQKKTKKLLWLVFFPGLINAILAWFLIPLLSFKIISLTSFISGWTLLIIPLFVKYYNEMINEIFGSFIFIIKMGIIVFAIFALTLLIKDFSLVIRLFWSFILIISYSYLLYFKKIIL
jgi:O-antigen/teichoic acid export membrane protein